MIKKILISLLLIISLNANSSLINQNNNKSIIEVKKDLKTILIDLKTNLLKEESDLKSDSSLSNFIKELNNNTTNIDLYLNEKNKLEDLNLKLNLNQKQNNILAIDRDTIKIETYKNRILFNNMLNDLILARNNFKTINELKEILNNSINLIDNKLLDKYNIKYLSLKEKDINLLSKIEQDIILNYDENLEEKSLFIYLIKHLENNIKLIYKSNFIKEKLNLIYFKKIINDYIETNEYIKELNNIIKFATKLTFGDIIIAIVTSSLIFVLRYAFLPLSIKLFKKDNVRYKTYIIQSIEKPMKNILFVLCFDVFINLIHNNQFNLNNFTMFFNSLYTLFFMIIIYNLINKGLELYSEEIFSKYPNLRIEMVLFTKRIVLFILFLTFLSIVLTNFGVNLIALAGGLGVLGISVGLAFKDIFGHFFGSIMILIDKPFSPGDWIVYKDGEGTVIEIGMRGTRIRTFDNAEITVTNSNLSNGTIMNWSKRKIGRRIKFDLPITYDTKVENLKNLIKDIEEMLFNHNGIINSANFDLETYKNQSKDVLVNLENDLGIKKSLMVNFTEYTENGKIINIYCFTKTIDWKEWRDIYQDILFKIDELIIKNECHIFNKNNKPMVTLDDLKNVIKTLKEEESKLILN